MSARRPSRLAAAGAALCAVAGAAALVVLGPIAHANPAIITVSPGIIHTGSNIVVTGTKAADAIVAVDVRPPGNARIPLSCTGTGVGSESWSCTLPASPDRPFGSHEVRAVETVAGQSSIASLRFQVVPDAVGQAPSPDPTDPPPPPPPPPPTPPKPPANDPRPPATLVAAPPAVQLETESLPEATPRATGPREIRPVAASAPDIGDGGSFLYGGPITFAELLRNPLTLAVAGGFGALILMLIAIPANILDSTIEANYERIKRPFARLAPRLSRFAPQWAAFQAWRKRLPRLPISAPLVIVLAAVAFGFTDPDFGVDLDSLRLTLALMLGLLIVVLLPIAITRVAMNRRWHVEADVVARPGAFLLAILGVLASRTIGFSPGILIGLVLGLELARSARTEDRSRATTIRIAATLVIGLAAWAGYSWLRAAWDGQPHTFGSDLMVETLAAAAMEGLSGIMVAILPITFLEGKDLFDTSRRTWGVLAVPTAFAFALIVLPTAMTDEGPESPFELWVAVLVGFSLLVFAIWLAFRLIPDRSPDAVETTPATPERVDA